MDRVKDGAGSRKRGMNRCALSAETWQTLLEVFRANGPEAIQVAREQAGVAYNTAKRALERGWADRPAIKDIIAAEMVAARAQLQADREAELEARASQLEEKEAALADAQARRNLELAELDFVQERVKAGRLLEGLANVNIATLAAARVLHPMKLELAGYVVREIPMMIREKTLTIYAALGIIRELTGIDSELHRAVQMLQGMQHKHMGNADLIVRHTGSVEHEHHASEVSEEVAAFIESVGPDGVDRVWLKFQNNEFEDPEVQLLLETANGNAA